MKELLPTPVAPMTTRVALSSTNACRSFVSDQATASEPHAFLWPAVTRYCGVLLKIKRFRAMRDLLRSVVVSGVYTDKNFQNDPFKEVIMGAEKWEEMDKVVESMGLLLLLCRLSDGQKGVMSKLHGTQLYVKEEMQRLASNL